MSFHVNDRPTRSRLLGLAIALVVTCPALPCTADERKPAEKPATEQADPFIVPDGTPEELLKYIENLRRQGPAVLDYKSLMEFRKKANRATLEASEKVLSAEPNDEQAGLAVHFKMEMLDLLIRSGDKEATKQLEAFPTELQKAGRPKLARRVRGFLLGKRLSSARAGGPEQIEKLVGEVRKFLAEAPPERDDIRLAATAAQMAERSGNTDLATATYREFGKSFAGSKDPRVAGIGKKMEGAARRLDLAGNEIKIEGTTVDGKPFDWSKYRGKVVLVDFWATWCGPCVAEIPNILKNYELYHDRGFEVVGISCDRNRESLEDFLKKRDIPWTILFSGEGPNPASEYYGILGIPVCILVGADGKVISLQARGPELRKRLEKLLGPVEEQEEDPGSPETR